MAVPVKAKEIQKLLKINKRLVYTFLIIALTALIFFAGLFLLRTSPQDKSPMQPTLPAQSPVKMDSYIKYDHKSTVYKGYKQEINILKIDLKNSQLTIKPVLSLDQLYGFEKLSDMAKRYKAFAAVNAGFFSEYGQPAGMVAVDGRLLAASSGRYPVFIYDGKVPRMEQVETSVWFEVNDLRYLAGGLNTVGTNGSVIVYTHEYGQTNRADKQNISIEVSNGKVAKIGTYNKEAVIPEDGILITYYRPFNAEEIYKRFKPGSKIYFGTNPVLNAQCQAYECGSWLIKNGQIVVPQKDEFIGTMANHDPRTAIGIMRDDTIVLITVDGRQPGYSTGFTGKELAEYLMNYGVENAAMLDGGASTEIIFKGKMVNRPSYNSEERLLGGALVVVEQ